MTRNVSVVVLVLCCAWVVRSASARAPMGSGFSYQGQLKEQGIPLDGDVDLSFSLFAVEFGGVALEELTLANVAVVNGLFTVELDFGATVFDGDALWLEVSVRSPHDPSDTEVYTPLSPRQPLTPIPYALQTRGLFVDDVGNVGIGTTDLHAALDVVTQSDLAVSGVTFDPVGTGVLGLALVDNGTNYGVLGQTLSPDGRGVYGWASANSGTNSGVYGNSASTSGRGVYGMATALTGFTFGVSGAVQSDGGSGVFGHATATTGVTFGVQGRSFSASGRGVYGWASGSTGTNYGVYGSTSSISGTGVYGHAATASGTTYGVRGRSRSDSGRGVYGWASGSTGNNYGVYGETASPDGYAGYFTGGRNYFEGNVGIGTESPTANLHVGGTDGVLFTGTLTSGTIPASGPGARMMWYPKKAAFRVGRVDGTEWDAANIGDHSVAMGFGAKASGLDSVAIGAGTTASGFISTAMGGGTTASGAKSTALGNFTTAESACETVVGSFDTDYTPVHTDGWDASDRLFVIGNGISNTSRSDAMVVLKNGNVGIGTGTPAYPLHVETDTGSSIVAINTSGYGLRAVAAANSGTNYGVYGETKSPDGYAGYFEGGRNYFQGKVGIGTESPDYPLHVESSSTRAVYGTNSNANGNGVYGEVIAATGVNFGVQGTSASTTGRGVFGLATAENGRTVGVQGSSTSSEGQGVFGFATANSGVNFAVLGHTNSSEGYAGYFTGGRNYFEGRVGIGTELPNFPLHVVSNGITVVRGHATATAGTAYAGSFISDAPEGSAVLGYAWHATGVSAGVQGQTRSPNGVGVYGFASVGTGTPRGVWGDVWSPDGYAGYFSGGRNYFEGSVGIGTDSPTEKLHLSGANANLLLRESGGSPYVEIGDSSTQRGYLQWFSSTNRLMLYTSGHGYPVAIGPTASGGLFVNTEANGGNVGIGTESPQAKLQIDSTSTVDALRIRVDGATKFAVKRNGYTAIGANTLPSYQLQVFGTGTAGKPGGGSWSNSSDRRLKKNVHDLEGSLDRLLQLRSVTFEYKDPKAINELPGERIGMIAQEVEEVFPDWVDKGGHGFKTLTFRGFEAQTVQALRELRTEKDRELASHDGRLAAVERENKELRARNADLESRLTRLEGLLGKE